MVAGPSATERGAFQRLSGRSRRRLLDLLGTTTEVTSGRPADQARRQVLLGSGCIVLAGLTQSSSPKTSAWFRPSSASRSNGWLLLGRNLFGWERFRSWMDSR